jgi:hypothetical protein
MVVVVVVVVVVVAAVAVAVVAAAELSVTVAVVVSTVDYFVYIRYMQYSLLCNFTDYWSNQHLVHAFP